MADEPTTVGNPAADDSGSDSDAMDKVEEIGKELLREFLREAPIFAFFVVPSVFTVLIISSIIGGGSFPGAGTIQTWTAVGPDNFTITHSYVDGMIYHLDPTWTIDIALVVGLGSWLTMVGVLLYRAGVIYKSSTGFKVGEMPTEEIQHKETLHASHALGLMIGPFLINVVIMICLAVSALGIVMGRDRDFSLPPSDPVGPNNEVQLTQDQVKKLVIDQDISCASPAGYFGTISGISANLLKEGYVFMFVGICVNAVIILNNMPPFLLQVEGVVGQTVDGEPDNNYPVRTLNIQMAIVRLGVAMTVFTAVMPDYAEGLYELSYVMTKLHLFGVFVGATLCLIGMVAYCVKALWTWRVDPEIVDVARRPGVESEADVIQNPMIWLPHGVTMVVLWVTIWMALGFLAANQNQPGYDSYYNICYLRDTNMRSGACELPASFDKDRYLVDAENEHPFTETIEENFENPPDCVLNYATTMCVKPNCAFREYSIGMVFEAALIFLILISLQLFIVTFEMDWPIHSEFVKGGTVFDAAAAASNTRKLETAVTKSKMDETDGKED